MIPYQSLYLVAFSYFTLQKISGINGKWSHLEKDMGANKKVIFFVENN